MSLPDLKGLSLLDLIRVADNPADNAKMMLAHRILSGEHLTTGLTTAEIVWLAELALTGGIVREMLQDLDVGDIARAWAAKGKRGKNRRGRTGDFIYMLAWSVLRLGNRSPMEVYRDIVLPALIELGQIQVDGSGEPDPYQDMIEQKNFLKAMARRRNTPRK